MLYFRVGRDPGVTADEQQKLANRNPFHCCNCHKPGHIDAQCDQAKLVFLAVGCNDESMKLLKLLIRDLEVNGKPFRVPRDSAAMVDVVHSSYVEPEMFTGECAWIKQAAGTHSICLPVAKVANKGHFGTVETEAAVSPTLPMQYPYLFSKRSDRILRDKGLMFEEAGVMAQTRPKARDLAAKTVAETALSEIVGCSESQKANIKNSFAVEPQEFRSTQSDVPVVPVADLLEEQLPGFFVVPTSELRPTAAVRYREFSVG